MARFLFALALLVCVSGIPMQSQDHKTAAPEDYLFVWAGDAGHKGNDFLAVIDADPWSASYGRLVTALATDQQTKRVHHTEYAMPASGMLFANDHEAGRTFIFDVRDPLHPKTVTSFTDMAGYMHPHSYIRLPNGNVLATFQHAHHGDSSAQGSVTGGLVEIDDQGRVVRSASNADPAFADALLMPYSLAVLPDVDRIVSTNSSMHLDDIFSGVTYQVWRLSDLKVLKTAYLDVGENRYAQISPEEAAWQTAETANTVDALRDFEKNFPGSAHTQTAQLRVVDLTLQMPATAGKAFDGTWQTTYTCPAAGSALGFSFQFNSQVKDGVIHGVHGTPGERSSLVLDGKLQSGGDAAMTAKGVVGSATFAVGGQPGGTPYAFHATAHFDRNAGNGHRIEGRPCDLTFAK